MVKKPKKGIYCAKCEGLVTIARKGKKRFFICENCGLIAHNPLPLIGMGARLVGGALVNRALKKSGVRNPERQDIVDEAKEIIFDNKDIPNGWKYIEKALQ